MKTLFKLILVLIVIALLAISGMKLVKKKREQEAQLPIPKKYALNIKVIKPKLKNELLTLPFLALTRSNNDVKISSKIPARIEFIIQSGKKVKKGETIAKLDNTDLKNKIKAINLNINSLKSSLKAQKVALNNLYKTHKRTKKLLEVKGATKEQFDKEITNIETLKSKIESIKYKIQELQTNKQNLYNTLSYTIIKAPISGIANNLSNIGDIAMMGKPLVSISSNTNSYLLVRLPDTIKAKEIIFRNKKIKLKPLNTTFNGLLEYIADINTNLAVNQTVNIDVVIFDNQGYKLPHDAILNRNGKNYILIIKKNKAIAKKIEIIANAEQGVIAKELNSTNKIVVAKQDILLKLLTGINVHIMDEK
jgi:multidrug efflux pump subunit AcrA (membrane-fusion protein)